MGRARWEMPVLAWLDDSPAAPCIHLLRPVLLMPVSWDCWVQGKHAKGQDSTGRCMHCGAPASICAWWKDSLEWGAPTHEVGSEG